MLKIQKNYKIKFSFFLSSVIIIFISYGYYLSDDRYFNKVISEHNIKRPIDAFNYINFNTSNPDGSDAANYELNNIFQKYQTPRYILTKRNYIWCDEGAIILATFAHELGYKTRLVDLINVSNGISQHTVLEIYEENKWILYDTQNDIYDVSYNDSAGLLGYSAIPRYRNYPRYYNFLVQNNLFIKQMALTIRSVNG